MPSSANARFEGFSDPRPALGPGDIVVVGAGLAGLVTALKLAPLPVTVIAAAPLGEGASSVWAQGGIAAAVGEGDTPEAHAADTIRAGGGIVVSEVARLVAEEGPDRIRDLLRYGVPFDRDLEGHFVLSREAAHTAKRVVRVEGDRAGAAIMRALIATVRATPSIRVLENYEADDLVLTGGRVTGIRLIRLDGKNSGTYLLVPASAVVLATGGVGSLYAVSTNPGYARGEALAFAARAGATIADAEFVQFHPTALDVGLDPAPLATEALRGEGALLVDRDGNRFMPAHHPDAELAPRDVVARAVFEQITAGRGAFLDCRAALGARFAHEFPTVYGHCRAAGLDPATDLIPIAPAAHYHMGGIATDTDGRTNVTGLWAVGEVASTGLHGANRLASNSLLEAAVFGARAAADIAGLVPTSRAVPVASPKRLSAVTMLHPKRRTAAIARLRETMTRHVGVVRDEEGLRAALGTLAEIESIAVRDSALLNMVQAAELIAMAALRREESRGGHYRSDFAAADPAEAHRSFVTSPAADADDGADDEKRDHGGTPPRARCG